MERNDFKKLSPKQRDFMLVLDGLSGALLARTGKALAPFLAHIGARLKWNETKTRRVAGQLERLGLIEVKWDTERPYCRETENHGCKVYTDTADDEGRTLSTTVKIETKDGKTTEKIIEQHS